MPPPFKMAIEFNLPNHKSNKQNIATVIDSHNCFNSYIVQLILTYLLLFYLFFQHFYYPVPLLIYVMIYF